MPDKNSPVLTEDKGGKAAREPLFHITKKVSVPWQQAWAVRIGSVVAALLVCALVTMFLTHKDPIKIYATMLDGAFGTSRRIWNLLQNIGKQTLPLKKKFLSSREDLK